MPVKTKTEIWVILFLITFPFSSGWTESAREFKEQDSKMREYMLEISDDLGVSCTECHKVNNFTDPTKPNYKKSREHIKITEALKKNGFDGHEKRPKATCYMCHRGKLKPDYLPKERPKHLEEVKKSNTQPEGPAPH